MARKKKASMNYFNYKTRIKKVREDLIEVIPSVCSERAELLTESYKETEDLPIIIRRAKALGNILSNMSIFIEDDQMINALPTH